MRRARPGSGLIWESGMPSRPDAGTKPTPSASAARNAMRSNIRIARLLGGPARMGDRTVNRRSHLLGVFPQIAGRELAFARLPFLLPPRQLLVAQPHRQRAGFGVDLDDVAVAHMRDGPADRRFRSDMADAETACGAGETPVGDQRH